MSALSSEDILPVFRDYDCYALVCTLTINGATERTLTEAAQPEKAGLPSRGSRMYKHRSSEASKRFPTTQQRCSSAPDRLEGCFQAQTHGK